MICADATRPFSDRLCQAVEACDNPTVIGLDTRFDALPEPVLRERDALGDGGRDPEKRQAAILTYNRALLEAVAGIVPAVKLQIACYEREGVCGLAALSDTLAYASHCGLLTIVDGKRNDIGSTAEEYARAYLTDDAPFQADALTVNAYLGEDGIRPFLSAALATGRGVFVLVRTSNASAAQLQDLRLEDGRLVHQAMADLVRDWGQASVSGSGFSALGAVVGATWPEQARELRQRMPRTLFLIPGYGAQGAGAEQAVAGFTDDGRGGLVNASRSILNAWRNEPGDGRAFADAARREALRMRDDLRRALDGEKGLAGGIVR